MTREISIAHSPDSDDAFMFYAIAEKQLDLNGLEVKQVMNDIQSLNLLAREATYDVTAISFAAYSEISDKYMLMPCGASFGVNYGPILIAKSALSLRELDKLTIAIPGKQTSAYLTLRLFHQNLKVVEHPFNKIEEAVLKGEFDAGLLIHEGQLTYEKLGLVKILDLGKWWHDLTGLPLPLGGNAIKKSLGAQLISATTAIMTKSISYALAHRPEALAYAAQFARAMPIELLDKYISMYVNQYSVDCGSKGRQAVETFFDKAYQLGIIERQVVAEFST
jgi:1,4-dihydroxy-6-naphthoate synthase